MKHKVYLLLFIVPSSAVNSKFCGICHTNVLPVKCMALLVSQF